MGLGVVLQLFPCSRAPRDIKAAETNSAPSGAGEHSRTFVEVVLSCVETLRCVLWEEKRRWDIKVIQAEKSAVSKKSFQVKILSTQPLTLVHRAHAISKLRDRTVSRPCSSLILRWERELTGCLEVDSLIARRIGLLFPTKG